MIETFLNTIPLVRVENQHFSKQVKCGRVGIRIDLFPVLLASLSLFAEEFALTFTNDELFVFLSGSAQNANSPLDLVKVIVAGEERSTAQKLCKDAADGPHIKRLRVVSRVEDDLRCSVPPGNHIFGEAFLQLFFLVAAGQSKVTDLQLATFVQKDI